MAFEKKKRQSNLDTTLVAGILSKVLLIALFILFPFFLYSQELSNLRVKEIFTLSDTVKIDTLSIIANSISIVDANGKGIDTTCYTIDYINATLVWKDKFKIQDSIIIFYRVFPYPFFKSFKQKDIKRIEPDRSGMINPFVYTYDKSKRDIFKFEGLNKSGSISRGISFGNNQDVIVSSSLDLRLSGMLSENINILAAITDDNIPIQPEGNTQQIQEFDKVFIQLSNQSSKLIAGDFELEKPESYFMNFYKKAQGVSFATLINTGKPSDNLSKTDISQTGKLKISTSAAISKGKYARYPFTGMESNQGPYKLKGSEDETFIIVLSGTEKVYLDGELLTRGQENDYVIDYNTAEITFTPKRLITKDKRVIVEFQYSEKNYTRSLLFAGGDLEKNKLKLRFNVYSEQDAKNQPLLQELTDEQKKLLGNIGDNLNKAVSPMIDSVGYINDRVLYKKTDSLGYDSVFVYSPDSGVYQLGFSDVGQGNGNYDRNNETTANGRVFRWVAPDTVSGNIIPKGKYEPVILLITPKKKQLITFSGDYDFSKRTKASFEIAASNNDINTFSGKDQGNDAGYAFKINFQNTLPLVPAGQEERPWILRSIVSYEQVYKHFSSIERYRGVEFERDWNLGDITENEYISGLDLLLTRKKTGIINYQFKSFIKGDEYNAFRNQAKLNLNKHGFQLIFNGSLLQTSTSVNNTQFIRSKASFSKKFKWFTVGVNEEQERNSFKDISTDTLQANSFEFYECGAFINNADTAAYKFTLNYKQRTDLAPLNDRFNKSAIGESVNFAVDILKNPNSRFKGGVTYRELSIVDDNLTENKPDNSLISRLEYTLKLLKGTITSSTFYEIGSGMEVKKEYLFVKVAAGQGLYEWIDRDSNNIEILDEFEEAVFQDRAEYIKVYTPTNEYIKTYTNLFNEVLYIKPSIIWRGKKGIRKFIGRFSNQAAYRIDRKTTDDDLLSSYNPFFAETADSNLQTLNFSFRNILYFNRTNPKFGADITYQNIKNKMLLVNGYDSRVDSAYSIRFRWNMSRNVTLNIIYKRGEKKNASELFRSKNYKISYYETEPKLTYQPNAKFRISLLYKLTNKENKPSIFSTETLTVPSGGETSIHQKIGIEIKHNVVSKGNLLIRADYINITYKNTGSSNASQNTSLAFEMLEGLQTGQNITWNASYQRSISKHMQLSFIYDGRKSEEINAIHTGRVQLRAYF
ncbi:MAG: hypothetical protein ABII90_06795 [Bacteroidota bacterium]